ncbi:MAG: FtsQ-type POTRA domain-containing protein [Thermacetogeniaceae bacterium]
MVNAQPVARKPRRANPRGYLRRLRVILLAAFIIYACYYFSQSPFFSIQKVEVAGQKHLSAAEIIRVSGLGTGINIFQVNLDQAKKRLLANPWIESAAIRRKLPRAIQITVKERQPSAILLADQRWLVLDRNGVCIDSVNSLRLYNLPIITGIKPDTTDPGKLVSANPLLQPVLAALDLDVENFFSEVNISDGNNLVAYTRDSVPVLLGKCEDLHSKLVTAQSLMVNNSISGAVVYVDLRSAQVPAVKYLETGNQKNEKLLKGD